MNNNSLFDHIKEIILFKTTKKDPNSIKLNFKVNNFISQAKAVEITFFLYPYSPNLDNTSFSILPYEEYVRDIEKGRRSTFEKIKPFADKLFGILLGLLIAGLFQVVKPQELYSLQSMVAVLGAYTLGKEMWSDLDDFLIDLTKKWRFRWRDSQYLYTKEDFGSVQRFWKMAREKRNGQASALPNYLDFITHSNAKTVELYFDNTTLSNHKIGTEVQFGNIKFDENKIKELEKYDYMLGFKFSISKRKLIGDVSYEIFQVLDANNLGTVDQTGNWQKNKALYRKVWSFGRFKYYLNSETLLDFKLIKSITN